MNPPEGSKASKGRAFDYMHVLSEIFASYEQDAEPGKFTRILHGGAFGVFRVDRMHAVDEHSLEISVFQHESGDEMATIVVPVEQCSIQFIEVPRTEDTEKERPFIGFTVLKESSTEE